MSVTNTNPTTFDASLVLSSVLQLGTLWHPIPSSLHLLAAIPQGSHVHQDTGLHRVPARCLLHGHHQSCWVDCPGRQLGRCQHPSRSSVDLGNGSCEQRSWSVFVHRFFQSIRGSYKCAIVSMLVQFFFAWRIWKLSKSYYMPLLISLVTLTQCAFAIKTGFIVSFGLFVCADASVRIITPSLFKQWLIENS